MPSGRAPTVEQVDDEPPSPPPPPEEPQPPATSSDTSSNPDDPRTGILRAVWSMGHSSLTEAHLKYLIIGIPKSIPARTNRLLAEAWRATVEAASPTSDTRGDERIREVAFRAWFCGVQERCRELNLVSDGDSCPALGDCAPAGSPAPARAGREARADHRCVPMSCQSDTDCPADFGCTSDKPRATRRQGGRAHRVGVVERRKPRSVYPGRRRDRQPLILRRAASPTSRSGQKPDRAG